jgi:hypothetical protein
VATTQEKIGRLRELYHKASDEDAVKILQMIEQLTARQTESPLLVGIGSGMTRVGQDVYGLGVGAGEMMGIADEGAFTDYRDEVGRKRALMDPLKEEYPWSAGGGEVVGEIAATLPFGGITGATAKQIPNFFGRLATNVGIGATQGALGADDPVEGAVWGSGGGAAGEFVGETMRAFGKSEMPNIPHIMEDVRPMRADDASSIYATAERAAEMLPIGRNAVVTARQKQQDQLKGALEDLVNKYDDGGATSEISESMTRRMKERKGIAKDKYNLVSEKVGSDIVGPEWKTAIAKAVDELEAVPENLRDNPLIDRLKNYIRGNEDLTWDQLRELRSIVGNDIGDTMKGGSLVGSKNTGRLLEAKGAISGTLDETAGESSPLWRDADTFYREEIAQPYKGSPSIVKDVMNKQSPEQMVDKLLGVNVAKNPTLVREVMSAMDPAGQTQMGVEIMRRAFAENVDGLISPAKAATFINSRKELFRQVLPNENWDEIIKYLRHIQGAGQHAAAPVKTGFGAAQAQSLLPGLGGAGAMAGGLIEPMTGSAIIAGSIAAPVIMGKITAALATGEPGAIGKVFNELAQYGERTGRLAGSAIPTDN